MNSLSVWQDTIIAPITASGIGAVSVIRMSGAQSLHIVNKLFSAKDLSKEPSQTAHVGDLYFEGRLLDEVVITIYKSPRSYTGEDVVEISCHGSPYIQQQIIAACTSLGARLAKPGEFTQRTFINGKMDLAQAEAVADLIASQTRAAQETAFNQLRGGFSHDLKILREELIHFAALIELELDFSEEDVTFADRKQLADLIKKLKTKTNSLLDSFRLGNAIKNGISVAIIGKPNAGKSTLLNALLNEERAIVSEIAGTTRDTIEESLNIKGVLFRLIDTAGIREHSTDVIENMGIERSKQNAAKADIILHIVDLTDKAEPQFEWLQQYIAKTITVYNKADKAATPINQESFAISLSAKNKTGVDELKELLYDKAIGGKLNTEDTIVTNARHHEALLKIAESLNAVEAGLKNALSGDLITIDIRRALHYLGEITGQVEIDRDILGTIFGKFCIGK